MLQAGSLLAFSLAVCWPAHCGGDDNRACLLRGILQRLKLKGSVAAVLFDSPSHGHLYQKMWLCGCWLGNSGEYAQDLPGSSAASDIMKYFQPTEARICAACWRLSYAGSVYYLVAV